MKKFLFFIGGIICGVLLLLVIQNTTQKNNSNIDDVEALDSDSIIGYSDVNFESRDPFYSDDETDVPGDIIHEKSLKVIDVGNKFNALVVGKNEFGDYNGTVYLLKQSVFAPLRHEMITFYDDQIVKVPRGKELRMFGTYTYETRGGGIKTVPIIRFVDKK